MSEPMKSALKNESGMTLVESMIAILILLFGLLALAQAIAFSVVASKTFGRDSGLATAAAHDKMEELVGLPFGDTTTNLTEAPPYGADGTGLAPGGSFYPADPVEGYTDTLDVTGARTASAADIAYTRQWQVVDETATRKRIIVSVRSNKSFNYGTPPSTVLVTQKTP